jgi:hypothetical protein
MFWIIYFHLFSSHLVYNTFAKYETLEGDLMMLRDKAAVCIRTDRDDGRPDDRQLTVRTVELSPAVHRRSGHPAGRLPVETPQGENLSRVVSNWDQIYTEYKLAKTGN